jgi:transposase
MRRYALHDDQWERIKDLLPGRKGHVGTTAKDNRLFVEAVLWRYRSGAPWRDLPERFGDWNNTHRRFSRWAETGVWKRMFKHLAADLDNEYAMIDSRSCGPINTASMRARHSAPCSRAGRYRKPTRKPRGKAGRSRSGYSGLARPSVDHQHGRLHGAARIPISEPSLDRD